MIHQIIFLYFAAVILVSAVLMITRKNPIHSVMFMLLLFFHIAGVFVLLNAEFLAAVQLIVYAGRHPDPLPFRGDAPERGPGEQRGPGEPVLALDDRRSASLIAGEIVLLVSRGSFPAEAGPAHAMLPARGSGNWAMALYQKYLVPFEIASVILLVGLVGAVMLAKKR